MSEHTYSVADVDFREVCQEVGAAFPAAQFRSSFDALLVFTFTPDLDAAGITTLDSTVAAHKVAAPARRIQVAVVARLTTMDVGVRGFIEQQYPPHRQRTLDYLRQSAAIDGLTNRRDYVDGLWAWIDTLVTYFYSKRDEVLAKTTVAEIEAVTTDFAPFLATDPAVTIEAARAILD